MTEKNQTFDLKKVHISVDRFVLGSIPVELACKRPLEEVVVKKLNSKGLELPLMQSSLDIKTKEGSESFSFKPLEQRKPLNSSLFIYFREQKKGSKSLMTQAHYHGYYNYNNIKKAGILRIEKYPNEESIVIETNKNRELPWVWLLSLGYKRDNNMGLYNCEFGVHEILWKKGRKVEDSQDELPYEDRSFDLDNLTNKSKLIRNARNYSISGIPVTKFKDWKLSLGPKDVVFVQKETERLVDMYLEGPD